MPDRKCQTVVQLASFSVEKARVKITGKALMGDGLVLSGGKDGQKEDKQSYQSAVVHAFFSV